MCGTELYYSCSKRERKEQVENYTRGRLRDSRNLLSGTYRGKQCAKDISELTGVTLRFALKILRKLTQSGITKSYKGVAGGYELNRSPSEISLGEIIECIDGPIAINHCLANEFQCTHVGSQNECDFHRVFSEINRSLRGQLFAITMDRFLPAKLLQNK